MVGSLDCKILSRYIDIYNGYIRFTKKKEKEFMGFDFLKLIGEQTQKAETEKV